MGTGFGVRQRMMVISQVIPTGSSFHIGNTLWTTHDIHLIIVCSENQPQKSVDGRQDVMFTSAEGPSLPPGKS